MLRLSCSKYLGMLDGLKVVPPIYFSHGYQIFLMNDIHINAGVFLGDGGRIEIGNGVLIGSYAQIYTTNHKLELSKRGYITPIDVSIGDNVWIGGGAIILSGVTIGKGCIIGAGSVVTNSLPENVITVGSPARVVKSLASRADSASGDLEIINEHLMLQKSQMGHEK